MNEIKSVVAGAHQSVLAGFLRQQVGGSDLAVVTMSINLHSFACGMLHIQHKRSFLSALPEFSDDITPNTE